MRLFIIFASVTLALASSNDAKTKRGVPEQAQIYGYKPIGIYQDSIVAAAAIVPALLPNVPKPANGPLTGTKPANEPEPTKTNAPAIYGYPESAAHNPLPSIAQIQHPPPTTSQYLYDPLANTPSSSPLTFYQNYQSPAPHQSLSLHHQPSHFSANPTAFPLSPLPKFTVQPKPIYGNVLHTSYQPQASGLLQNNPFLQQPYQKPLQIVPSFNNKPNLPKLLPIVPNTYSLQQTHANRPWKPMPAPQQPVKPKEPEKKVAKPVVEAEEQVEETDEKDDVNDDVNDDNGEEERYQRHRDEGDDDDDKDAAEDDDDDDGEERYRSERYRSNDNNHEDDDDEEVESRERYEDDRDDSRYHHHRHNDDDRPYKHYKVYKPYKKYGDDDGEYDYRYKSRKEYGAKPDVEKPSPSTLSKSQRYKYEDREPKSGHKFKKSVKMNGFRSKMDDNYEASASGQVPAVHNKKIVQEKWYISKLQDMSE